MAFDDFSSWLQSMMDEKGFSQAELARLSGLTRQSINNYLARKILVPDQTSLQKIAHVFGMRPEDIYRIAGILPPANGVPPDIARAIYQLEQLPDPLRTILTKMIDAQYHQWENDQTANLKTKPRPNG